MLVLFDIDLTLLDTGGAGGAALREAAREAFGRELDDTGVAYAGRLDPLILADLLTLNGIDASRAAVAALAAAYTRALPGCLGGTRALPGAAALVRAVASSGVATAGVLTGNYRVSGEMKLRAAGFDPATFEVAVWGDESPHHPPAREHLPPVAIERDARRRGRRLPPAAVTIIGDTPHDVSCALASGCRVLAVATGRTSAAELRAAGADRVVDDLSETEEIFAWLTSTAPA